MTRFWGSNLLIALALVSISVPGQTAVGAETRPVTLWHLPKGAIQPQAAVDSKGTVHIIYYQAGAAEGVGNLYYIRLSGGAGRTAVPIRVNSKDDSTGCIGTVRTAQIAIGKGDRVHVVWNGLGPKDGNGYPIAYQAYTRLNEAGTAFEPQRDLITWAKGIDGGGSVAADREGNVYVTWHAIVNAKDEAGRAVFMARSSDNGAAFLKEKQINPEPTGACACCGMRAFADSKGILYVLYRAATDNVNRDTMLLVSRDRGQTFVEKRLHLWNINACPMSTYSLTESKDGIRAAWETKERIYYGTIDPVNLTISGLRQAPGTSQKHPFVTSATNGQTLLTWTERTGWARGGSLAWEVINKAGAVTTSGKRPDVVPVWGLATAYARQSGGFVIVY